MLFVRMVLSVATILLGIIVVARMLVYWNSGFAILPGLVLGAAMIALGAHRIMLILRVRRMT
ncbi:MAG TPA: hypothetical protein VEW74_02445 [Candidatus Nitrosotalea sp.]|nr:hypothetical protein [Candidatus Nitrosotalea sp.]